MGLGKQLGKRLAGLEKILRDRPAPGQFGVVEAIPMANAGGRTPGLYPSGPKGSTAGVLVYDPAEGGPVLPDDERTQGCMFIVCEPASFQPGIDYAE